MGKYFFIIILSLFINGCTLANNFNDKVELITNNQKKSTFDSCTNFSYISNINDKDFGVLFRFLDSETSSEWLRFYMVFKISCNRSRFLCEINDILFSSISSV